QIQIVAAAGAAVLLVPWRAVADSDVEEVEIGIVGHGIPYGSAPAELPPFARPGLCSALEVSALERFRGIAGHGVEPPDQIACVWIVGGHIAAHAHFGS